MTAPRRRPMPRSAIQSGSAWPERRTFAALACIRTIGALVPLIQDCDEVFNFWDPAHYLVHGQGLQTWEYSAEYAIRSWAFVALYALPGRIIAALTSHGNKVAEFYIVRTLAALACAACETALVSAIARTFGRRLAMYTLIFTAGSSGMLLAAPAFLPSSFAMCTTTLALAAQIKSTSIRRTTRIMTCFCVGGALGWPFSLALAGSMFLEELLFYGTSVALALRRVMHGMVTCLAVVAVIVAIDSAAYRKLACVALNIVKYNVLAGEGRGPNLYGTEPWHYYAQNLFLSFNVASLLACISAPCLIIVSALRGRASTLRTQRLLVLCIPMYSWLAIFTLQPHKEERFMFPIYTALAMCAAISMGAIDEGLRAYHAAHNKRSLIRALRVALRLSVVVYVGLSLSRVLALGTSFSAPLMLLQSNQALLEAQPGTICYGRDWYRFPSSYFVPSSSEVGFVKSGFTGILPGQFERDVTALRWPGMYKVPEHMNDLNLEEPAHYTHLADCTYFVLSEYPSEAAHPEPEHKLLHDEAWQTVECLDILDVRASKLVGRAFRVPGLEQRQMGRYCLLQRK